jgi:hypothetical protein
MSRFPATLGGSLFLLFVLSLPVSAVDPYISPDGVPYANLGGIIVYRLGNQNITSIGGGPIPRHVWTTTTVPPPPPPIPFAMPGIAQPAQGNCAPALLRVTNPDTYGLVYIEGELVRSEGKSRRFQSPPLPLGKSYPLHLRVAFKVGDNLLIEDKEVLIQPGVESTVGFEGTRAVSVPLKPQASDLPPPRKLEN